MTGPRKTRIVVVTSGGQNPQIMINALQRHFGSVTVVHEQPESKPTFVKRRARKLGWITALGQLATMIVSRFGKRFTTARADEIMSQYHVSDRVDPAIETIAVGSINDLETVQRIRDIDPAVVFLISCRMLKAQTLAALPCPVINFHAGINPAYRGLMGGYWALVNDDAGNFGATVHLVDAGVDTGGILYQSRMQPSPRDTLHTYPLLQTASSVEIAIKAVEDALAESLMPIAADGPSQQWYHPPLWTWVLNGIRRGIW